MSEDEGYQSEEAQVEDEWLRVSRQKRKRARLQITEEQNAAMEEALKKCSVTGKQEFLEVLSLTTAQPTTVQDIENDRERELVFMKQALDAAIEGCDKLKAASINYRRPEDYFAEMAKSDAHMLKIQERLAEEKKSAAASEAAKRNREMRKFGKQVQQAKLKERDEEKKRSLNDVKRWRKDHAKGEEFPVELAEDAPEAKRKEAKRPREEGEGGSGAPSGKKSKRELHEAKYKYAGKRHKGWKVNDRESYSAGDKAMRKSLPAALRDDDQPSGGRRGPKGGKGPKGKGGKGKGKGKGTKAKQFSRHK